jgi:Transposase IS66 family
VNDDPEEHDRVPITSAVHHEHLNRIGGSRRRLLRAVHDALESAFILGGIRSKETIRGRSPPERRAARQEYAVPLLNEMHAWITESLSQIDAKSDLSSAFNYSLNRWEKLCRYTEDGTLEIDNLIADRSIRGMGSVGAITHSSGLTVAEREQPSFTV